MKERLEKLLTVKSIVTLIFTIVVAFLAFNGKFDIRDIYTLIIGFYFGTQAIKDGGDINK